jgi:hypothetical protein
MLFDYVLIDARKIPSFRWSCTLVSGFDERDLPALSFEKMTAVGCAL